MADTVYFVIPCYNEEEVLPVASKKLKEKLLSLMAAGLAGENSRILFVDDGSRDATWDMIEKLCVKNRIFSGLKLSRNRGHQNALIAGLFAAKESADAVISMDADLQDDIEVTGKFLKEYYNGCDIVYGVRSSRQKDTFLKRATAEGFYRLMQFMGTGVIFNHADYRLMSKRVLDCLEDFREVNLFLRGIVPLIGFKSTIVTYERGERAAGKSKYPLKKMIAFALDGITSFSTKPIRFITLLGLIVSVLSAAALIACVALKIAGLTITGWASVGCSIWFLGGVQLLSLGVIGEYTGKVYSEVKNRPRYFIEKHIK